MTRLLDRFTKDRTLARPRLALAAALLVLVASAAPLSADRSTDVASAPAAVALFVGDDWERQLQPLDPTTLADVAGAPAIRLAEPLWPAKLSADGSTFVEIDYHEGANGEPAGDQVTLIVRDGVGGPERTRVDLPSYVVETHLSHDGARLVAIGYESFEAFSPPTVTVVDTATGAIVSTVHLPDDVGWQSLIDPTARRLYGLIVRQPSAGPELDAEPGPWPVTVTATDLSTGAEVGRLELPSVQGGLWWTEIAGKSESGEEAWAAEELRPAMALSPDGRKLVFVHADGEALTLVDAERLVVARTVALTRPSTWTDRLLALLPLVPQPAAAKQPPAGTTKQAVFAPDGRNLYVFGRRATLDETGRATEHGLGLQLVDVDDGLIVAEALPIVRVDQLLPVPDGTSVFVAAPAKTEGADGWIPTSPYVVRRLDAATLATLAERTFVDYRELLLVPVSADQSGT